MTEIAEAVAVLLGETGKDECPFCGSKEPQPGFETLELTNDSALLAKSMGRPSYRVKNPDAEQDYDIFDTYWVSDSVSKICLNAHHILPGNASVAKCPEIRKWMAGKTVFKKKFYDSEISRKVKKVESGKRDATRANLVAKKYETKLVGDPETEIAFSTIPGRKPVVRENTVNSQHVTGTVDFDVNHTRNGIWLPSNNAIADWSDIKGKNAEDLNGDDGPFAECYAFNCMEATGYQFHDAHPDYSDAVVQKLKELEIEVNKFAIECQEHTDSQANKNGGAPYPAPRPLAGAIYKLAGELARKLKIEEDVTPTAPWITSQLSAIY